MNYGNDNTKLQIELVVSSCAVRLARHSQNAWALHVERVESCRDEPSGIWAYLSTCVKGMCEGAHLTPNLWYMSTCVKRLCPGAHLTPKPLVLKSQHYLVIWTHR